MPSHKPRARASALRSTPAYPIRDCTILWRTDGSAYLQHHDRSKYMPHQGLRERARRLGVMIIDL